MIPIAVVPDIALMVNVNNDNLKNTGNGPYKQANYKIRRLPGKNLIISEALLNSQKNPAIPGFSVRPY